MENTYTPQENFMIDISMVLENDQKAYNYLREKAKHVYFTDQGASVLSDSIREYVEENIANAIKDQNSLGRDLIMNAMLGWGAAPYDLIARDMLKELAEDPDLKIYTLSDGNGQKIMRAPYEQIFKYLLKTHGSSVDYSLKYRGYTVA